MSGKSSEARSSISSAPKRPQKLGDVQGIVRNDDMFKSKKAPSQYEEITLSDDDDDVESATTSSVKCATCRRDMTLWTTARRKVHMKICKEHLEEKQGKAERRLTETMEKDEKVRFVEPKPPKPLKLPKTSISPDKPAKPWEISKNKVKFSRIEADDEANRRRKRPRSFAVVELAPTKCECKVVTTLHSRFMDEFHFKSIKNNVERGEGLSEHAVQMSRMIQKLTRLEQLSSDMQKVLDDTSDPSPPHFIIKCSDGQVKCHKLTAKHRTSLIKLHPSGEMEWEKDAEVVRSWLTYVYTARMEWSNEQEEEVLELAVKYGPVGLESAIKTEKRRESSVKSSVKSQEAVKASENVPEVTVAPEASNVPESEVPEVVPPQEEEEPDVYTSDDPFIGFGKAVEEDPAPESELADQAILLMEVDNVVPSPSTSTPKRPSRNTTLDSFDEWSSQSCLDINLHSRSQSSPSIYNNSITPIRSAPKPVFGSHVRILKTSDVTPMPEFDQMDETELKERMKEIGLRPKGKKAMIQILKKAYTTLHPEICTGTPTIRPLIREEVEEVPKQKTSRLKKTLSERLASPKKLVRVREEEKEKEEGEENEGDKTLNVSNDERDIDIGRICGDNVIGEDEEEEPGPSTGKNDLSGLREAFLAWLRNPQNIVLYEHILSLQPVSLEEMLVRLEKADGPLGRIGKAKLVKLLELLKITYQLPQKNGARRKIGGGAKFKKRF